MKYRSSKLGTLAVALAFALTMGVSNASATEFTAASYPASLEAEQPAGAQHEFEIGSGNTRCTTAAFTGTLSGATTSITITPHFTGCTTFGLLSTVTMNGCDYRFNLPAAGNNGTTDIVCPSGNEIVVDTSGGLCDTHYKAQSGLPGIAYQNNGKHVDLIMKLTSIHAVVTGKFLCPIATTTKTFADAKYTGMLTVKASGGSIGFDVG